MLANQQHDWGRQTTRLLVQEGLGPNIDSALPAIELLTLVCKQGWFVDEIGAGLESPTPIIGFRSGMVLGMARNWEGYTYLNQVADDASAFPFSRHSAQVGLTLMRYGVESANDPKFQQAIREVSDRLVKRESHIPAAPAAISHRFH
jgi:hypothetical protein